MQSEGKRSHHIPFDLSCKQRMSEEALFACQIIILFFCAHPAGISEWGNVSTIKVHSNSKESLNEYRAKTIINDSWLVSARQLAL